jgi:tetratricopeptide (TPR) repeat protein
VASDLARAAARCAIAMRQADPDARLAVVTGRVESVEALVARAPAGAGIRVDETTAGLLDSRFEVGGDAAGLVLRGEREADEAPRTLLGKSTRFVGRDRELAQLEGIFDESAGDRVARPVLVLAAAGMGKSRLRQELVARLRARDQPVEVWTGRGDPMRAGAPFGLLGEALRRTAGILGGDDPGARRARLEERVGRRIPAGRAAALAAVLGEIAGVPFPDDDNVQLRAARRDPVLAGDLARGALVEWLAAECAAQPLVLVLEDLHWGDLPSVRLVDAALRELAEHPLFVLALARPEVRELFPRLWGERGLHEIHLGALARRAGERLIAEVLGPVAPEVAAGLIDAARGNALFLEELIRQAAAGETAGAPETVLAILASRIAALAPEARRVLRAGSVFGESFWAGGVRALVAAPVDAWLDLLVEQEVIGRVPTSRFAGEVELRFVHGLVREAAYSLLTGADRALGHQVAGAWLAEAGETDAVVIAEHHERGGEQQLAATWYRRAAEQALAGNDVDAAVARAQRGVACGAAGAELGALLLLEATAHRFRGDNTAAERQSLAAMDHLAPDGEDWSLAFGEAVAAAGKLHRPDRLKKLVDGLGARPSLGGAQAVAFARAATQCFANSVQESGHALVTRVNDSEGTWRGDPRACGFVEGARGFEDFCAVRYEQATRHNLAAIVAFGEAGDARNACLARMDLGYTLPMLGAHEEAETHLRAAIAEGRRLGMHAAARMTCGWLALSFLQSGRRAEALALAREGVDPVDAQLQPRVSLITRSALGVALWWNGDLAAAEVELRAALGMTARNMVSTLPHGYLAALRVAQGAAEDGLALALEAISTLSEARGLLAHEGPPRLALLQAYRALGRDDDAKAALAEAARRRDATAAAIETAGYRESFLRRVWTNERLAEIEAG